VIPALCCCFWLPASGTHATAGGGLVGDLPEDGRAHSEIRREGACTAVLLHDPALLVRRTLLDEILAAAALSVEIARLRVEVRLQLAEVQASRERIVTAGYEERRRLERDLHDGAQQRLVSLGLRVRRMQRALPAEAAILAPALNEIVGEMAAAIADLRQIAAGVRPARLDDGLAAALRDLARTAPIPVAVDAPIGRVAASTEAAAYFVACEGLTNAVKHASASEVSLVAVRDNGALRVSVTDDGVGGAAPRRGGGLAGLRDRVATHGGTLEVHSPRGGWYPNRGDAPVRLVIAEDTVLLREGLAGLLEDAGHDVVARVGDVESLLAVVAEHEPELAIVDVRMPPTYEDEGMVAAAETGERIPRLPCSSSRSMSKAATWSSSSGREVASATC
jgi:CheY-like chemotaxis protein